jgi:hypothetical protein
LAEIELKKELDKKKQNKSSQAVASEANFSMDSIRSKLSKKQQESLDLQIEKENKIRNTTKSLDDLVNKATSIIVKLIQGNKDYLVNIVNSIIHLTKSPLCSTYMFRIYKE